MRHCVTCHRNVAGIPPVAGGAAGRSCSVTGPTSTSTQMESSPVGAWRQANLRRHHRSSGLVHHSRRLVYPRPRGCPVMVTRGHLPADGALRAWGAGCARRPVTRPPRRMRRPGCPATTRASPPASPCRHPGSPARPGHAGAPAARPAPGPGHRDQRVVSRPRRRPHDSADEPGRPLPRLPRPRRPQQRPATRAAGPRPHPKTGGPRPTPGCDRRPPDTGAAN